MPYCSECDKIFATRQSIWKHRQRKHVDQRKNILEKAKDSNGGRKQTEQGGGIIGNTPDKVIQKGARAKTQKTCTVLPIEAMNEPESKILMDIDGVFDQDNFNEKGESGENSTDESDYENSSDEIKNKNWQQLKIAFRNHYYKLEQYVIYNELMFLLDEMEKANYLSKEDRHNMEEHLQEKICI